MLTLDDLLDYCDLDRDEIAAVAEHEHIPLAVACELGECLLGSPEGVATLHQMVQEDISHACETGHATHAAELVATYRHLQATHPLSHAR